MIEKAHRKGARERGDQGRAKQGHVLSRTLALASPQKKAMKPKLDQVVGPTLKQGGVAFCNPC